METKIEMTWDAVVLLIFLLALMLWSSTCAVRCGWEMGAGWDEALQKPALPAESPSGSDE